MGVGGPPHWAPASFVLIHLFPQGLCFEHLWPPGPWWALEAVRWWAEGLQASAALMKQRQWGDWAAEAVINIVIKEGRPGQ